MQLSPEKNDGTLGSARKLLEAGKPREAADLIRRHGMDTPELRNMYAVGLMRAKDFAKAIEVFRELVLHHGSVCVRSDVPTRFKTNFATALLMTDNVAGCLAMLRDAGDEQDPGVIRLRGAIARWKQTLTWWQRLRFVLDIAAPSGPVPLDFEPGELREPREHRPAA